MILGGDLAGKAIQTIVRAARRNAGTARSSGPTTRSTTGPSSTALEKLIADHGYYPYRAEPGELEARQAAGTLDDLFLRADARAADRAGCTSPTSGSGRWAARSTSCSATTTRPTLAELLDDGAVGRARRGQDRLDRRRPRDDQLGLLEHRRPGTATASRTRSSCAASLARWRAAWHHPERAIVNVHVPPFGTQLDDAPVLDENLQVQQVLGQVKIAPVGSTAVRDFLTERQPLLGPARPHPRGVRDPPARPDDRHQSGQRLLDRRRSTGR